jgi:HEAT repeat protein
VCPATLLAVALAAGSAAGAAAPGDDVRAEVRALLGVIERPVSPESFRRFGAEGEAALEEIARSPDLPPRRARALEVLAGLRAPRAEEVHREIAATPGAPRTVRRAAVLGLGRLVAREQAVAALRPFLEADADPRVRAAAAEALARAAPLAACRTVRRQVTRETASARVHFRRALAACE